MSLARASHCGGSLSCQNQRQTEAEVDMSSTSNFGVRDSAHDLQSPCEKEVGQNCDDVVVHRREEGYYSRCQNKRRVNAIVTRYDRYREADSSISQDARLSDGQTIEGQNDGGTKYCEEPRERLNARYV